MRKQGVKRGKARADRLGRRRPTFSLQVQDSKERGGGMEQERRLESRAQNKHGLYDPT